MANTGHIYSYDIYQNATFPGNISVATGTTISAPSFTENGTTLTNKYQAKDGDLTAIAALTGTGYAKRTADNT